MTFLYPLFATLLLASSSFGDHPLNRSLCLQTIVSGLDNPIGFVDPGTNELYIVEQQGYVKNINTNDTLLDISDKIFFSEDNGEKGLYSVVFSPDWINDGKLYAMYAYNDDGEHITRISEFDRNHTERVILDVPQPTNFNNGGSLFFDPNNDSLLFASLGDGGSDGSTAQDTTNFLGSILRVDINNFPNKILHHASGFRNPWRCTISEDLLFCGDAGENLVEEIDLVLSGGNYGWNIVEGDRCFLNETCNTTGLEPPIYTYQDVGFGAVIGGYITTSSLLPSYHGDYLFGDLSGALHSLTRHNWTYSEIELDPECERPAQFILSFGRDSDENIYLISTDELGMGDTGGRVQLLTELTNDMTSGANKTVVYTYAMLIISLAMIVGVELIVVGVEMIV